MGTRYRGRFAEYDLNNEMIHGNYYEKRWARRSRNRWPRGSGKAIQTRYCT